jgi:DNA-binding CsgD family transcriptional regulator
MTYKLAASDQARLEQQRNALREHLRQVVNGEGGLFFDETISCNRAFLIRWVQSQFGRDTNWDGYRQNGWHLDHAVPVSSFDMDSTEQRQIANCYRNIQPMRAQRNLIKGNRIVPHDPKVSVCPAADAAPFRFTDWAFVPKRGRLAHAHHAAFLDAVDAIASHEANRAGLQHVGGPEAILTRFVRNLVSRDQIRRVMDWLPRARVSNDDPPQLYTVRRKNAQPMAAAPIPEMVDALRDFLAENWHLVADAAWLEAILKGEPSDNPKAHAAVRRFLVEVLERGLFPAVNAGHMLTFREAEVLRQIACGKTTKETASALAIAVPTAANHLANVKAKLDIKSTGALIAFGIANRITAAVVDDRADALERLNEAWNAAPWFDRQTFIRQVFSRRRNPSAAQKAGFNAVLKKTLHAPPPGWSGSRQSRG